MSQGKNSLKVAYLLDIFPALSETFVINELIELKRQGLDVAIFSLGKPKEDIIHKEAKELAKETCYFQGLINPNKFRKAYTYLYSHLYFLLSSPLMYIKALWFAYINGVRVFKSAAYYALVFRKFEIGHIHAHFAAAASEYAMMISRISGIPYSFTPHAYDIFIKPKFVKEKVIFADFVVSKTEYNRRFLEENYPGINGDKIHVIHYGIDLERFTPAEYDVSRNLPFTILSVARLVEKKGHKYLLEACNILTKKGISNFVCKIIGDGPLKGDLEELALSFGLSENVQFIGALPSDKVLLVLKESDLFVLPCIIAKDGDMDGMPNALIEAMALGKPVISTYISGIPELIKDGAGILVPPEDPEALAKALEEIYLMVPETRMAMGQKGREIVEREFNIAKESEKIRDIFVSSIQKTDKYWRLKDKN